MSRGPSIRLSPVSTERRVFAGRPILVVRLTYKLLSMLLLRVGKKDACKLHEFRRGWRLCTRRLVLMDESRRMGKQEHQCYWLESHHHPFLVGCLRCGRVQQRCDGGIFPYFRVHLHRRSTSGDLLNINTSNPILPHAPWAGYFRVDHITCNYFTSSGNVFNHLRPGTGAVRSREWDYTQ